VEEVIPMDTMTLSKQERRGRPVSPRSAAINDNMARQAKMMEANELLAALVRHSKRNLEIDLSDNELQTLVIKSLKEFRAKTDNQEHRVALDRHIASLEEVFLLPGGGLKLLR
jgi:hypothetical protein